MTELTEQEREEAFITLALSQKNAELYRRYGAMSPDELDKTGIPDLRRKMWEMTSRLIFAGLLDKECCVPFEKTPPDDYFSNRVVGGGPGCQTPRAGEAVTTFSPPSSRVRQAMSFPSASAPCRCNTTPRDAGSGEGAT